MDQPSIQTTSLQKHIMGNVSSSHHPNKTFLHPSIVRAKASSWPRHAEVTPLLLVINSRENSCSSWCNGSQLFCCFFGGEGEEFGGRGRVVQVGYGFHCFFDLDFGVYIIYQCMDLGKLMMPPFVLPISSWFVTYSFVMESLGPKFTKTSHC